MDPDRGGFRALVIVLGIAGAAALIATLGLGWHNPNFHLGVGVRLVMGAAGLAILALATTAGPRTGSRPVLIATLALGICVLAYPTLLGLAAALPHDPVASTLGTAGHTAPLLLLKLIPILAATSASVRNHRRWEVLAVTVDVCSLTTFALGAGGLIGSPAIGAIGSALWFGSLLIPLAATWSAVPRTAGLARRRTVLAALAAMVPLVLITWCVALGALGVGFGLGDDWSVSTLMLGFSAATTAGAALALGSTADERARLLRIPVLRAIFSVLLGALALLIGCLAALISSSAEVSAGWSVAIGSAVTVAAGLGWWRLRAWARRIIDPASRLRDALAAAGDLAGASTIAEAGHRQLVLAVLRRLSGDADLEIDYLVGSAADATGSGADRSDIDPVVVLARATDGTATVVATCSTTSARERLMTFGDCSQLLRPALLEAEAEHTRRLVHSAAETERRRLSRNLHDGLQGRLLGLALNLQLTGQELEDPAARLLVEETVGSLRSMIDDVRSLGGGRLPEVLATEGLEPALRGLLAPLAGLVVLGLPPIRLAAPLEETAYFVIGEAMSNALKHAEATAIGVRVSAPEHGRVTVTIDDDGRGGADPRAGSGLRSLAERVSAGGGSFVVRDRESGGTVVETVLPCGA